MSIIDKPTIYNTPTIYNVAGGGGGAVIDPNFYEVHQGIKRINTGSIVNVNNFGCRLEMSHTIEMNFYFSATSSFTQTWLIVIDTNKLDLNIGRSSATQLNMRFQGLDKSVISDVPGYFRMSLKGNKATINGVSKTSTVSYTNGVITRFFESSQNESVGSIVFSFKVYNDAGNMIYDYTPVKRLYDGKIGLYDPITDNFVEFTNCTLVG